MYSSLHIGYAGAGGAGAGAAAGERLGREHEPVLLGAALHDADVVDGEPAPADHLQHAGGGARRDISGIPQPSQSPPGLPRPAGKLGAVLWERPERSQLPKAPWEKQGAPARASGMIPNSHPRSLGEPSGGSRCPRDPWVDPRVLGSAHPTPRNAGNRRGILFWREGPGRDPPRVPHPSTSPDPSASSLYPSPSPCPSCPTRGSPTPRVSARAQREARPEREQPPGRGRAGLDTEPAMAPREHRDPLPGLGLGSVSQRRSHGRFPGRRGNGPARSSGGPGAPRNIWGLLRGSGSV
ncbi:uncharacterized protein LOC128802801 isoform X3 [Vidua macroura]|uniref:uncharacterized protein LOC128802801 isoform X3 n=1 Tax=Vidua macroura TaxID=187451 RepID=UPI0023A81831|nr:uncharacterized protein LOC128802801 isoform X3 [Vidua macroura]